MTVHDVAELLKAINFTGLAAVIASIGTVYAIVAANRAKEAANIIKQVEAVSVSNAAIIEQVKQNTDGLTTKIAELSHKEGVRVGVEREALAGEKTAQALAQGQREGREQAAASEAPAAGKMPLPVADDRTAVAAERSATATERVATATETKNPNKKE